MRTVKCLAGFALITLTACDPPMPPPAPSEYSADPQPARIKIFEDITGSSGLDFRHDNGATGALHFPEIMGSGVALLDYDNDGDLDIYACQGIALDRTAPAPVTAGNRVPGNRLYRNRLVEDGKLRFEDVTTSAGLLPIATYGMGVATADIDNDGDVDLYATQVGINQLFINLGNGTFRPSPTDVDGDDGRWSTSATFSDFDNDGLVDLAIANYVAFSTALQKTCHNNQGVPDYCHPSSYQAQGDRLLRNTGGTFEDSTAVSGIGSAYGPGLGIVAADFDGDHLADIYVANDGAANLLWRNAGNGRFVETGLLSGAAYNADGNAEAGMGIAPGDGDADGDLDLFVTHLRRETNTFYVNDGRGDFMDQTTRSGLAGASLPRTAFGTDWLDIDNDGLLDLYIANGGVERDDRPNAGAFPYDQPDQLFRNAGGGRFVDISRTSGPAMQVSTISRGVAVGDIDNDGDIDIVVSDINGPLRLLRNLIGQDNHWLSVRLRGTRSNRDAIGAMVGLTRLDGTVIWRHAHRDGSYLSARDIRVHFGLGKESGAETLTVIWPSGLRERWPVTDIDRQLELVEGSAP